MGRKTLPDPDTPHTPSAASPDGNLRKHGHSKETISHVMRLMLLGKDVREVAEETGVCKSTVYEWQKNLLKHGSIRKPRSGVQGRPKKMTKEDEDALLCHLIDGGWQEQKEQCEWLLEARGVKVTQSTVSRLAKRMGWSEKNIKNKQRPGITPLARPPTYGGPSTDGGRPNYQSPYSNGNQNHANVPQNPSVELRNRQIESCNPFDSFVP
jgi:transposase